MAKRVRHMRIDKNDPAAVANAHAFIRRLYEAGAADRKAAALERARGTIRFRELETVFAFAYRGGPLTQDDAGERDLYVAGCHLWHIKRRDHVGSIKAWAAMWAPWCGPAELTALIERVEADPRKWTADPMARELGVTDAIRTALGLTTIGAIDFNKKRRKQRRGKKSEARSTKRRRKAGAVPRDEWLTAHSENRTKPWLAEGKSRATHFREKAAAKKAGIAVETSSNAALEGESLLCSHLSHDVETSVVASSSSRSVVVVVEPVAASRAPEAPRRLVPPVIDVVEVEVVGVGFGPPPPPVSHTQRGIERALWRQQQHREGVR